MAGHEPAPPLTVPIPVPVPERPAPTPRAAQVAQPGKGVGQPTPTRADPTEYTKLPDRKLVFELRDDAQLEKLVLDTLREAEVRRQESLRPEDRIDPLTMKPRTPVEAAENRYPRNLRFPAIAEAGAGVAYVPKTGEYPPARAYFASLHLMHRRLHFEDKNTERYGWDLGWIQPLVSTMVFYRDVLLWPYSLGAGCASGFWDTNVGKCLPGSPTPYFLYPPGLTVTGTAFEGVIITGAAFALP